MKNSGKNKIFIVAGAVRIYAPPIMLRSKNIITECWPLAATRTRAIVRHVFYISRDSFEAISRMWLPLLSKGSIQFFGWKERIKVGDSGGISALPRQVMTNMVV